MILIRWQFFACPIKIAFVNNQAGDIGWVEWKIAEFAPFTLGVVVIGFGFVQCRFVWLEKGEYAQGECMFGLLKSFEYRGCFCFERHVLLRVVA